MASNSRFSAEGGSGFRCQMIEVGIRNAEVGNFRLWISNKWKMPGTGHVAVSMV
jgi:hypothetical protein